MERLRNGVYPLIFENCFFFILQVQAATTEETDLYNDVLASSNAESKPVAPDEIKAEPQSDPGLTNTSATPTTFSTSTSSYKFGAHGGSTWTRRVSLYIGNLTWVDSFFCLFLNLFNLD